MSEIIEVEKKLLQSYKSKERCLGCLQKDLLFSFADNCLSLFTLDFIAKEPYEEKCHSLLALAEKNLLIVLRETDNKTPLLTAEKVISEVPSNRELMMGTLSALLSGDPASDSPEEIVASYPGFKAIGYYRVANSLYRAGAPLLARLLTERGHSQTGIDIHPGATIGKNFFIDHGTGIVIGETSIIGDRVKIYQGVTLGALSLRAGSALKGQKRHPTIGNDVTIYSNASILGDVLIGEGSTIGASVFLTHGVPPFSKVSIAKETCDHEINHNPLH